MQKVSGGKRKLLNYLGELGQVTAVNRVLDEEVIFVEDLDDGGMGSFKIGLPPELHGSQLGRAAATVVSEDADGVMLIATLFLNERGFPYEVDIWKVDFSALITFPENWRSEDFPRFPGSGTGRTN